MTSVRPGQIWADNDPRSAGRTLRIDAVDGGKAICTVLTNTDETQAYVDNPAGKPSYMANAYKDRRGTTTQINVNRFVANSTGYRLAEEA